MRETCDIGIYDINCACRPEYFQAHSYIIMCESLLSDGGDLTPINRNH